MVERKDKYMTLPKANRDSFVNYLTNQISNKMGARNLAQIKIDFPKLHGRERCRVNARASQGASALLYEDSERAPSIQHL